MPSPLHGVQPVFRAVATIVVPEARALTPDDWVEVEEIVERALVDRPTTVQRQIRAFLRLLNVVTFAISGRRFTSLDDARRLALLERLARSPLLLVRRGVWGIRTLAFMGYYARPSAAQEIRYRASAAGWTARPSDRPGRVDEIPLR